RRWAAATASSVPWASSTSSTSRSAASRRSCISPICTNMCSYIQAHGPDVGHGNGTRAAEAALAGLRSGRVLAERALERAARGELRNRRRRDLNLLGRVARVDALPRRPVLRRELPETRERDRVATLERLGHRIEKRVHGLRRVALRKTALRRDLVHKLLLC